MSDGPPDCRALHELTLESDSRALDIAAAAPDCVCEQQQMSVYSPGPVQSGETLNRFLFDIHITNKGTVRPSAYSHAFRKGCSIQREDRASDSEIGNWIKDFLQNNPQRSWRGVARASCQSIRDLRLTGSKQKLFCVYDTAEFASNPAHGEICICLARPLDDEGEMPEARKLIRDAFGGDAYTGPAAHRAGRIEKMVGR